MLLLNRNFLLVLFFSLLANFSFANEQNTIAQEACLEITKRLASVKTSDCDLNNKIGLTGQLSVQGRPILQKEFPANGNKKPKVLLIGGIHGDELTSISIVFNWMRSLNQNKNSNIHWNVVPLLNPDGLFTPNEATRTNANGVDLNRNFPTANWQKNAIENYWIKRTDRNERRYPGHMALSEPESMWLALEIERFRPDVIVAVHAPYGIIDFDGPPEPPSKLGRLNLELLGTYPGSLGNYAGVQKNVPVVTIELKYAKIMPPPDEIERIWQDLNAWVLKNIPKDTPPIYNGIEAFYQKMIELADERPDTEGSFTFSVDKMGKEVEP